MPTYKISSAIGRITDVRWWGDWWPLKLATVSATVFWLRLIFWANRSPRLENSMSYAWLGWQRRSRWNMLEDMIACCSGWFEQIIMEFLASVLIQRELRKWKAAPLSRPPGMLLKSAHKPHVFLRTEITKRFLCRTQGVRNIWFLTLSTAAEFLSQRCGC